MNDSDIAQDILDEMIGSPELEHSTIRARVDKTLVKDICNCGGAQIFEDNAYFGIKTILINMWRIEFDLQHLHVPGE
jgi:hypothetical protein